MIDPHPQPETIPVGARLSARILLLDPQDRVLLFEVCNPQPLEIFWVTPGGGLEPGESFPAAAERELREETGITATIGPWVWTREHHYTWNGRPDRLYERYFVARTDVCDVKPQQPDEYHIGHRWWSASEIDSATVLFAPRQLAQIIRPILHGEYPPQPIDVGM